jgi:hypothetical protein
MVLLEDQLIVKKSSLPGSGKGLFTKKLIPKGTRIVEYKGRIQCLYFLREKGSCDQC